MATVCFQLLGSPGASQLSGLAKAVLPRNACSFLIPSCRSISCNRSSYQGEIHL
jgi:hypothetical protein